MNSHFLQQEHASIYESFFSHNEMIFSHPLVMTWCGDISGEDMIHIQSRIPLRVYTGINRLREGGIQLSDMVSYKVAEKRFHMTKINEHMPFIDMLCGDLNKLYPAVHADISVLSEGSRSIGLGCTSILLWSIYLAVRILDNPELWDKLPDFSQKWSSEYNTNQTLQWLIQEFVTLIRPYKLTGSVMNVLTSFFADLYPFCGFGTGIGLKNNAHNTALYCFSLRDFLPSDAPKMPYQALDVAIFYSGQPVFAEQLITGFAAETSWLDQAQLIIRDTLNRNPHNILPYLEPSFLRTGNDFNAQNLTKKYGDILSLNTLEVFSGMLHIHLHSYDEDFVKSFLQKLNKITWVNYVTRPSAKSVIRTKSKLGYLFKDHIGRMGLFPNDTTVMGWCINIASPVENLQKEIEKNLLDLNSQTPESGIIYVSWKDGGEENGFALNQNIWKGIMSPFASKNIGILQTLDNKKVLVSLQELESRSRGVFIFDTLTKKVILHRRQITSRDLPSQQTTCDIIKAIVLAWGEIHNTDLPKSSYSTNKNDMQGKIFTPLNKLYQSTFGKDFPIKIFGSMSQFTLSLDIKNSPTIAIFYEII
jgi:hypothetical protein